MRYLDEQEVLLVQNSLPRLLIDPKAAGDAFYANLFSLYPQLRPLFKDASETQGEKLMTMLAYIVSCLDNLEELDSVLQQLGKRHRAYKTEEAHYPAVRHALVITLRSVHHDHEDLEGLTAAWGHFYDLVAERMLAPMD